jgi:fibronectin-binding autotransporter adhesin
VTVNGNNASRVFQIDPNVTASISGLKKSGGNASNGGGQYTKGGNVTLTDCAVIAQLP